MKQLKIKQKLPTTTASPQGIRAEIDAAVHYITSAVEKNPKKVAVIIESWMNPAARSPQKKKAA
jgi:hypothetical protein